jgi:hypothetical protein
VHYTYYVCIQALGIVAQWLGLRSAVVRNCVVQWLGLRPLVALMAFQRDDVGLFCLIVGLFRLDDLPEGRVCRLLLVHVLKGHTPLLGRGTEPSHRLSTTPGSLFVCSLDEPCSNPRNTLGTD